MRLLACLVAVSLAVSTQARPQKSPAAKKITINGKLRRATGIGGEGAGWTLELKREITLEGKKLNSIEVSGAQEKFEEWKEQRVNANGTLVHHHGVERGDYLVLEMSSVRAAKRSTVLGEFLDGARNYFRSSSRDCNREYPARLTGNFIPLDRTATRLSFP
jgi:hypothetical protein